jgi:sporulation protein YlmC with PRC-barrel domain
MRIPPIVGVTLLFSTAAFSQQYSDSRVLTSLTGEPVTVTNWYKQNLYDSSDNKVGEVEDVLVQQKDGHIAALIVGVAGFLGIGEKRVAISFNGVKGTKKNNTWYLTTNATKDDLKNAPAFIYEKESTRWVLDDKQR